MTVLILINNHNSFKIIDFVKSLSTTERPIDFVLACEPKFLNQIQTKTPDLIAKTFVLNTAFKDTFAPRIGKQTNQIFEDASTTSKQPFYKRIIRFAKSILQENTLINLVKEVIIFKRLQSSKGQALKYLKELKPVAVMSNSDRSHDYAESSFHWAAKQLGIKVILPYVANYSIEGAISVRVDHKGKLIGNLNTVFPPSLYKYYSRWKLKNQIYQKCFYQVPYLMNAHRRSGTLSQYPWWFGFGLSDIVCVNSQYTKNIYLSHGVAEKKIIITGDAVNADVFQSYSQRLHIRNKLISEYHLSTDKKIVVLSLPQHAEQGRMHWDVHMDEIEFVVSQAAEFDINLLISLHPRQKLNDYAFLAKKYKCKILKEPFSYVVGAIDVFLCSGSSTMVWSVLCEVPTMNFDFNFGYDLYNYLNSVKIVHKRDDYKSGLHDLLYGEKPSFENDWKLLSRTDIFKQNFTKDIVKDLFGV